LTWPIAAVADRRHELPEQVFLLVGLGVTNAAVARALVSRGRQVVLVDDAAPDSAHALAAELGVTLHVAPDRAELAALIASVDAVVPAPGLPGSHPVFGGAADAEVPVLSEFDLAAAWDDRPLVAVTGTNGKTTVTTLVQTMLDASGVSCAAVGNLEVPLVAAIDDPEPACFAVEASSFRLGHSRWFRPAVAVWLNFAPDHLDAHRQLARFAEAGGRLGDAETHFNAILRYAPDDLAAHRKLGLIAARAERLVPAATHFRAVLRLAPEDADAHANLGNVLLLAGDARAAIASYETSLRLRPADARTRENLQIARESLR
jgi:UDP-N-acetylmuramoylalanine-D-glutamate ligase